MNRSAPALRERFAVYGRFYDATLGGQVRALRSHLEIFAAPLAWPEAAEADADLVAVMMNPGASRPLAVPDAQGWAPAVPDRTQYQLMRLALHAQASGLPIHHIRVINLSDLRTPRSAVLFDALATLSDDRHSIFSARRAIELRKALGRSGVPVLRAWGMAQELDTLARSAIAVLGDTKVLGLTDNGVRYRHPLPQRADLQRQWLRAMCEQLTQGSSD